ncbi:hypothetical protein [Erythrobacter rubeus]|uniref:Glycosyl transferase family 28 C-terminal domain-containing protein n=1 Tax=Erythrobacter rubeus TaxID=2760803 RepID=A0ABR8KP96_9SPHN|nr:hypothetical protein [Erythrobacter rubeus]MBD2842455.1 hypothetical protein [Erythrobacter rubeus]
MSRCIALAEALRLSGVESTFAGKFDAAAQDQLAAAGFNSVPLSFRVNSDADDTEVAGGTSGDTFDFTIIDSYRADEDYLLQIKSPDRKIVVIDDFRKLNSYPCDVVLNFTWDAPKLGYQDDPVLLLGPEYFLARRRLVDARGRSILRDRQGEVRNLLIAIGGSDPKGLTGRLLKLLRQQHAGLCVHAIGTENDEAATLLGEFDEGSRFLPRQPDLSEPLLWADAALTGGGLIKYECAYMGVPAAAIAQNEGQDSESQSFARAGLVHDLGLADQVDDERLSQSLEKFLSDANLRASLVARARETFPSDPAANAADAILEAVKR